MFPRGSSSGSADQPDPNFNPSTAPDSRSQPSSSSATASIAMNISTDNTSLIYGLHPQPYHQERQHQSALSNLHQWTHLSHYSAAELAGAPPNIEELPRYVAPFMQSAASLTREEAQQLLMQDPVGVVSHKAPAQLRGLSMVPIAVEQQLYNEQLILRSLGGRTQYGSGVEPRSMYDSLQQVTATNLAGSSSVLNRTLENIGRSAPSEGAAAAAAGRYEETCTPRPRWCPTQEQIQILESLFNSGTTTPSREMIVDIAAQLRKYGTIAEANVFYWFQNRKARAKRKLQPPPAAVLSSATSAANPASSTSTSAPRLAASHPLLAAQLDSSADHMSSGISSSQAAAATATISLLAGGADQHATHFPKTRRLSLKHTSASSPSSSSTSPDHAQHSLSVISGGPTSSSPLRQPPSLSMQISRPPTLLQESSLLLPNVRGAASSSATVAAAPSNISRPHQPSALYNPWTHEQLQAPPEEVAGAAASDAGAAASNYPHPLLHKHASNINPTDSQMGTFHKLLDYSRISLSLAPPTDQHQSSIQGLPTPGHGQTAAGGLGYSSQYSDHRVLQATSKGIMLINQQEALGREAIIGGVGSRSMSTAMFPQLDPLISSRPAAELGGAGTMEFNPLQPLQLPQSSSVPLARLADYQQGAPGSSTGASASAVAAASLTGAEQLQMWEDLDSACGGPWNGAGAAGPSGHH